MSVPKRDIDSFDFEDLEKPSNLKICIYRLLYPIVIVVSIK